MSDRHEDTHIGGNIQHFPTTSVSAIQRMRHESPAVRKEALQRIVECYWKPAYKYTRIKWRKSNEDAKDLIQGFFAQALEKGYLREFDATKGRFRTYFRVCLDGFLSKADRAAHQIKRGGDIMFVTLPFDEAEVEIQRGGVVAPDSTDDYFRKEWVRHLLSLAIGDLHKRLAGRSLHVNFRVFERHDLGDPENPRPAYADLATEFGISVTDVTNFLARARQDFREIVLERLRDLTSDEEEYQAEARALLGPEHS